MRKFIYMLLICIISVNIYAYYENPMSLYKDNFFVAGNDDDQVKFQISAKYNIFYPAKSGLFLGYTQISWWKCYGSSDTFSSNYQPEIFYKFESKDNIFNDLDLGYIDYIQFSPIQHSSTGTEGDTHRAINIYYAQVQVSIGEVYNFGINGKIYGYYSRNRRNADINEYRHNYDALAFFKLKSKSNWYVDKFELHAGCTGNPTDKGYYVLEGVCQIFTSIIQPKLFVQYNDGYGINMVDYNKKEKEFRGGLIF